MLTTIILSLVMMAGLFLMLYAGVALIQNPRFFSSAPKEVQAAVQPKPERFRGAHFFGWFLAIIAIVLMGGAVFFGCWDGIRNGYSFGQFFLRFLIMLLSLKAYDVLFFDFFLLCRSDFFPRYYPEVKELLGPHLFGYNWKSHVLTGSLSIAGAAALAGICVWIAGA